MTDQIPPTYHATQVGLVGSIASCSIAFGHNRQSISTADVNGDFRMTSVAEWVAVFELPPEVARKLSGALGRYLADYEAKFGALPIDPAAGEPGEVIPLRPAPSLVQPERASSLELLGAEIRSGLAASAEAPRFQPWPLQSGPTRSPPAELSGSGQSLDDPDPPAAA